MAMRVSGGTLAGRDAIYISERQKEILAPLLPRSTRLHYVPNPVDIDDRGAAAVAVNNTFVFIGRLSREKGAALFAEAVRRTEVKACFVGDGPLRQEIETLAPNAQITGWVSNRDVVQKLRIARSLVFPSLWYETFGLSVREALANGVPPIVRDNTTSAEVIEHGRNGLLFKSGDIDSLISQIRTLQDSRAATQIGQTAYDRYWHRPPTLERHTERLEEVYRQLLSERI
jgi:glycosyltransferase involved in cell wall biosynthesis